MNKKKIIIFISSIVAAVLVVVVLLKFYPIVFVDWQPIFFKKFETEYSSAYIYYQKALEIYDRNELPVLQSEEARTELKRAVLDKLIENILVEKELRKRLKNEEIERMVNEKIDKALKGTGTEDINKKIETIYEMSLKDFKKIVLEPQAKKEIFASRLFLENKNFNEELKKIKKESKVMVFLPGFKWDGERVIIK